MKPKIAPFLLVCNLLVGNLFVFGFLVVVMVVKG